MAAAVATNPQVPTESKSARKKKAKAELAGSPAPSKDRSDSNAGLDVEKGNGVAGSEAAHENSYIKEIQK
jgi:outer membrane scaffolding protein for murein synthesis (MipA/OmpV family)